MARIFYGATPDPLNDLRFTCTQGRSGQANALREITAVGAVYTKGQLSDRDLTYLNRTFVVCAKLSLPISSEFNVTALNLAGGACGDFLKRPRPTDLLLICYVYNGNGRPRDQAAGRYVQSENHFVKDAWLRAATIARAKVIVTFGRFPYEVTSRHFGPADGSIPIYSKIRQLYDCEWPRLSVLIRNDIR